MVWPIIDLALPHEEIKLLFHSLEESNSALANLLHTFGANTRQGLNVMGQLQVGSADILSAVRKTALRFSINK
jgi:hypothetical protein